MKFRKTKIDGVYVIQLEPRQDIRGYFSRIFCKDELKSAGLSFDIVQANRSKSVKRGTIRGLHYQNAPHAEDKIVQCVRGAIFDVALDLRPGSKTYGTWVSELLTDENNMMLLVPKGCAHGFQSLKTNAVVEYFVSEYYAGHAESGIRWNDPAFSIAWPIAKATLSDKDANWPLVKETKHPL